jgi:uncharacterized protein (UPF0264 family)
MRLLVSVESAEEALAAIEGGAEIIDAKDPRSGALGAVSVETFRAIHARVGGAQPVTAAIGDAASEAAIENAARTFADAGAAFVKVGFHGITSTQRVRGLSAATVRGAKRGGNGTGVVVVAYADSRRAGSLAPQALTAAAAGTGIAGLLIDTADKSGPGLRSLVTSDSLGTWVADAHRAGLFVALAGKLTADDFGFVRDAGADIAGVRGAACDGGRIGRVVARRVRILSERRVEGSPAHAVP